MARERRTVKLCDICQSENDVVRVRIHIGEERFSGDVCARHRKAVVALAERLPSAPRGILAVPVVAEDEWERQVRRGRRAPKASQSVKKDATVTAKADQNRGSAPKGGEGT